VHTNIVKIAKDNQGKPVDNLYQYNEVQYDKDEYINLTVEKINSQQTIIDDILVAMVEV